MNLDDRRVLRRAAKMLLVDAAYIRDGCEADGHLWGCPDCPGKPECHAQRAHDAHIRAADQLKAMARGR